MPDTMAASRRRFLKTAAGASALAAVPYFIPATALGKNGATPPSERILVGGIGIQGRGMQRPGLDHGPAGSAVRRHLRPAEEAAIGGQELRRQPLRQPATAPCIPEINGFLAARPDIDAVLIATGDRWHAMASILAMRAGKDVYTEKPSCMTIAEGRAVVETARRYGRVYQTGTQRLSEANHVFCIEMARSGRLGKIHTAYAHIAPWDAAEMRHDWLPAVAQPPKDEVDWDAWLGSCPWRPYNPSLRRRRVAGPLRLPHQLHRRVGGAYLRPGPGRAGLRRVVAHRVRIRGQRQRRRHGHPLRQRRADDPLPRQQVLARLLRRAVRRQRGLGRGRRRLREARCLLAGPAGRVSSGSSASTSPAPAARWTTCGISSTASRAASGRSPTRR